ncbi:unnamed protein product [Symbiodinium sp. CCMP2592]|nr:unnamed protein product [Symbiodinium sp. CCMP2592]
MENTEFLALEERATWLIKPAVAGLVRSMCEMASKTEQHGWELKLPQLLPNSVTPARRSRHRNQSPDPSKVLGSIPGKTETSPRPADAVQPSEQAVADADAPEKSNGGGEVSTPGTASECTDADPGEVVVAASPAKQTRPGLVLAAALLLLLSSVPWLCCRVLEVHLSPIHLHFQRTDRRDHLPSDISRQQVLEVIRDSSALPKRWQISQSDAPTGDPVVYVTTSTASRWEENLFVESQFRQLEERIRALLLIRMVPSDQCGDREERDQVEEFISEHISYKHFRKLVDPVWICSWDGELKSGEELRRSVSRLDRALLPYWWAAVAMPKFL